MKNKIYCVIGTKGGVGKTETAKAIAYSLAVKCKKFKVYEFDLSNESYSYSNSEYFKDDTTIYIHDTDDMMNLSAITLDYLSSGYNIIIDAGAGQDTLNAIKLLQKTNFEVVYLIPVSKSLKALPNIDKTIDLIGVDKNITFVLNPLINPADSAKEFPFFFGDKKKGIKSFRDKYKDIFHTSLPYSIYFELSDANGMYIGDLAKLSENLSYNEAAELFIKTFITEQKNVIGYETALTNYLNSQEAAKICEIIKENFHGMTL